MKQMLLMLMMRNLITFADNNKDFSLEDPFADVNKAEDIKNETMMNLVLAIIKLINIRNTVLL